MQLLFAKAKRLSFLVPIFLLILTLLSSCDKKEYNSVRSYSIGDKQLQRIKGQTALLVLPAAEYENMEDYKALLPEAWTLTPIEVIKYSDLGQITDPTKYAFFNIRGQQFIERSSISGTSISTYFYLTLSSYYAKGTKVKSDDFGRIELYPDFKSIAKEFSRKQEVNSDRIYTKATIRNFSLPYMLSYLRFIQKNLEEKTSPSVYKEYTDNSLRGQLASNTLYVPAEVLHNRNMFTGKETDKDENFFSSYKGQYKIVTAQELTEIIKNKKDKKPLFLFEYVQTSGQKFVSVLDVTSGTVAYRRYQGLTYNLKAKDIERILN